MLLLIPHQATGDFGLPGQIPAFKVTPLKKSPARKITSSTFLYPAQT